MHERRILEDVLFDDAEQGGVIEDPVAASDRRISFAERIPRETDARGEVLLVFIGDLDTERGTHGALYALYANPTRAVDRHTVQRVVIRVGSAAAGARRDGADVAIRIDCRRMR